MKALTVRQPWAYAIATGAKTVENRPQRFSHRGQVAIHAGSVPAEDWTFDVVARLTGEPVPDLGRPKVPPALRMSAVIAVVDVPEAHDETVCGGECSPWAMTAREYCKNCRAGRCTTDHAPLWHYELRNARLLSAPVPATGRLGLFNLPDVVARRVALGLKFDHTNPGGVLG